MGADVHLVVLFQVVLPGGAPQGWAQGPLPLDVLLTDDFAGKEPQVVPADAVWRQQHLLPRVADVLTGRHRGTARLHRTLPPRTIVDGTGELKVQLDALELLLVKHRMSGLLAGRRRRVGVLAAHLTVLAPAWDTGDGPGTASSSRTVIGGVKHLCRDLAQPEGTDLRWALPAPLRTEIGPGVEAAEGYDNGYLAVLLTPRVAANRKAAEIPGSADLWNLAMASPSKNPGPPAGERDDHEAGVEVTLPKTDVLVTRLGLVQRGRGNGEHGDPTTVNGKDRGRFRTIYLDGLLMVMMQQRILDELTEASARLIDPLRKPRAFNRLSRQFRRFRVTWWWRGFSRWRQPDRVVTALQGMLDLGSSYEELREDHAFFAEMLRAAQTSRLNMLIIALTVLSTAGVAADIISAFTITDVRWQAILLAAVPVTVIVGWAVATVVRRMLAWVYRA